jgi:putative hydrolase of the HAD superfamily
VETHVRQTGSDRLEERTGGEPPHGRIEVLLLDVGGVLVPFPDPMAVARLERELALAAGGLRALLYECEPWYALSTGRLDEDDYWRALGEHAGREPATLRRLLQPVWELGRVDEDVVALARAVRSHVRVALLSNSWLRLEEQLCALGVDHLFDPIINSARVGLRKPDPRIFLHALEILRVLPGAVLFVDDQRRNTRVAEELGIPSVCFHDAAYLAAALARHGLRSRGDEL